MAKKRAAIIKKRFLTVSSYFPNGGETYTRKEASQKAEVLCRIEKATRKLAKFLISFYLF